MFGVIGFSYRLLHFILIRCKGTLDGSSFALNSDGFEVSCKRADSPLKLTFPAPMRGIR